MMRGFKRQIAVALFNRRIRILLLVFSTLLLMSWIGMNSSIGLLKSEHKNRNGHDLLRKYDVTENQNCTAVSYVVDKYQAINPSLVIYNRLPKCASTTMRRIIQQLHTKNHFHFVSDNWPKVKQSLVQKDEIALGERVSKFEETTIFVRHLYFMDFKSYAPKHSVTFINVIRDPVDRFVSHYYFMRYGMDGWSEYKIKKWLGIMSKEKRQMSLDECLKRNASRCVQENREKMIEFFCGMNPKCRLHDRWSVDKAKANIIENYSFIGLSEKLEETLQIFEKLLPRYFTGASTEYDHLIRGSSKTRTANKVEPSEESKRTLREQLWGEIEIYNFVLQHFW